MSIYFIPDTAGKGVDAYVAHLLRQEAIVDSTNNDPHTTVQQFKDYYGPARPFIANGGHGLWLEGVCDDCTSGSLFFERRHLIAELSYEFDDREINGPRLACRLRQVAQTFKWVE